MVLVPWDPNGSGLLSGAQKESGTSRTNGRMSICNIRCGRQILLAQIIFEQFEKRSLEEPQRKIYRRMAVLLRFEHWSVARRQERFEFIGPHFEFKKREG